MKNNNLIFAIIFIFFLISISAWAGDTPVVMNGYASADSVYDSNYVPSYAADGNSTTAWVSLAGMPHYWQYDFPSPVFITKIDLTQVSLNGNGIYLIKNFQFLGSSDGTVWYLLYSGTASNTSSLTFNLAGEKGYSFYRIKILSNYETGNNSAYTGIWGIVFFENGIMGGMSPDEYAFTVGLIGAVCGLVFCIGLKI